MHQLFLLGFIPLSLSLLFVFLQYFFFSIIKLFLTHKLLEMGGGELGTVWYLVARWGYAMTVKQRNLDNRFMEFD